MSFILFISIFFVLFLSYCICEFIFGDRTYTLVVFSDNSCRFFKTKVSKYRIKRLRKDNIGNPIISILCFNDMLYLHDYIKKNNLNSYYFEVNSYE